MKKMFFCTAVAIALSILFAGHGNTQPASKPGKPAIVYVTDFEFDSGSVTQERRLLQRPRLRQEDPGAKAAKLVELLSTSLAGELQNKSIPTKRLYRSRNIPNRGWLVTGQFLEVDEGKRLRRAMVGFGAGATEMQIEVAVIDLGNERREPFLVFGTDSKTGRGPGAVLTMNPYVAAAKFVMSKKASERDVRKTARQIAGVLVKFMEENNLRPKQ